MNTLPQNFDQALYFNVLINQLQQGYAVEDAVVVAGVALADFRTKFNDESNVSV